MGDDDQLRKRRKEREKADSYHIHGRGENTEDFVDRKSISLFLTSRERNADGRIDSFLESTTGNRKSLPLSNTEKIRVRIKSTMLINLVLGLVVLSASVLTLCYCSWKFPRMTQNGFRGILTLTAVQGHSLTFATILGLHIYKKPATSKTIAMLYNSLMVLIIVVLAAVYAITPDTSSMVLGANNQLKRYDGMNRTLANGLQVSLLPKTWCCGVQGYKEICNGSGGTHLKEAEADIKRLLSRVDGECSKLMGWAMAETLIKSGSCFFVPALFLIILMSTVIHYLATSRSRYGHFCPTMDEDSSADGKT